MAPITKVQSRIPFLFWKKAFRTVDPVEAAEAASRLTRVWAAIAMLFGLGIGGLVMWEHDQGQDVIAAVNGSLLDKEQLFQTMQAMQMTEGGNGHQLVGSAAVHQMVENELLIQYAKSKHAYPSRAQVEVQYDEISKLPQNAQLLATESPETIKYNIRLGLIKAALYGEGVTVSDQEVLNYYRLQTNPRNPQALYYRPEMVLISVIVSNTEEESKRAWHDLVTGIPFSTVVQARSVDKSRNHFGFLPPIRRGLVKLEPDFEDTVFHMRIGERIGPRRFYGKWWIIRCRDRNTSIYLPLNKVKAECLLGARAAKGAPLNGPRVEAEFTAFKKQAKYQAFWPIYADAFQGE